MVQPQDMWWMVLQLPDISQAALVCKGRTHLTANSTARDATVKSSQGGKGRPKFVLFPQSSNLRGFLFSSAVIIQHGVPPFLQGKKLLFILTAVDATSMKGLIFTRPLLHQFCGP